MYRILRDLCVATPVLSTSINRTRRRYSRILRLGFSDKEKCSAHRRFVNTEAAFRLTFISLEVCILACDGHVEGRNFTYNIPYFSSSVHRFICMHL